jgi:ABC-type transporter Mla subunit MlaD
MPRRHGRNLAAAGLFLVLMGAAAVAILVLVGGRSLWFEKATLVRVRFDSAPNVKPGSAVLLAGQPVGRVRAVRPVEVRCPPPCQDRTCYRVDVVIALPQAYRLYRNARVVISQSLIGQTAIIDVEDPGFGTAPADYLEGSQASPFAAAADELGIGDVEKENLQEILANLRHLTDDARREVPTILAHLKAAAANLEKTTDEVEDVLPDLRTKLMATVADLNEAAKKAKVALDKTDAMLEENRYNIEEAIFSARRLAEKADADGSALLAKANQMMTKMEKDVEPILTNLKAASESLKAAMADFRVMAGDSKTITVTNKSNINKTLLNLRMTSEHLKAVAEEVRRAPWRLLARPDQKEVETLNLYDAARAFASAATDLDSCTDTLQTIVQAKQEGLDLDPEILKGMVQRLEETFNRYREAEDALWKEFNRIKR